MQFNTDCNPSKSAVYLVDRDKQGKWYRFYNAETDTWGQCQPTIDEAYDTKNGSSPIGFFPWVGPLTGPNFKKKVKSEIDANTALVNEPVEKVIKKSSKLVQVHEDTKVKPSKKVKKSKVNDTHNDGDIIFRMDRKKFVTFIGGKQVAARPTIQAIQKYLKKNHGIEGQVKD